MPTEFVTLKISKSTFDRLKEYRDKNKLSMTDAIQNGLACLSSIEETKKTLEEQKEKQEYYEIQDIITKNLIETTIKNWLQTVDEKKVEKSIGDALQSFEEIKEKLLKDPSYEVYKNKDRIIHEIFKKYIRILITTLETTEFKSETKNRISDRFLKQLLAFDEFM